ncbi:MAG: carbon-nitrogen hydrolase [Candidatus Kapaibacteriales bacterium]
MSNKTKILIDQFEPKRFNLSENFERVFDTVNRYDSDIYVFPELSSSGYFYTNRRELKAVAIEANHPVIDMLQCISTDRKIIICFGFAEKEGTNLFNSAITLFPNQEQTFVYRKSHLFYKESTVFSEGNTGFQVRNCNVHGLRIGTMICYDWRFPESARSLALNGADIILCPSNLVTDKWQKTLGTRALENNVFVAVSNRIGSETEEGETLTFNGSSTLFGTDGQVLAQASRHRKAIILAEFNYRKARDKKINSYNDLIEDRRPDLYAV